MAFSEKKFKSFDLYQQTRKIVLLLRELEKNLARSRLSGLNDLRGTCEEIIRYFGWMKPGYSESLIELYNLLKKLISGHLKPSLYWEKSNPILWLELEKIGIIPRDDNFFVATGDNLKPKVSIDSVIPVLFDLRSPFNFGSILRTADFFGIQQLLLCNSTIDISSGRVKKTAKGSEARVSVIQYENEEAIFSEYCDKLGFQLWGVETMADAQPISSLRVNQKDPILIAFGNEEYGLKQSVLRRCTRCVCLPALGHKNSLNISTMAAIVLYELTRNWGL